MDPWVLNNNNKHLGLGYRLPAVPVSSSRIIETNPRVGGVRLRGKRQHESFPRLRLATMDAKAPFTVDEGKKQLS
jgi:hypothetical protein